MNKLFTKEQIYNIEAIGLDKQLKTAKQSDYVIGVKSKHIDLANELYKHSIDSKYKIPNCNSCILKAFKQLYGIYVQSKEEQRKITLETAQEETNNTPQPQKRKGRPKKNNDK